MTEGRALLRQSRSRATRERLTHAAERLWQERGFDEVTVAEICEAAGVAKATFHFHFERKEDLLIELGLETAHRASVEVFDRMRLSDTTTDELLRALLDSIAHRVERSPRPLVRRTIVELFRSMDRDPTATGERPSLLLLFTELLDRGQQRGDVPANYAPAELAMLLTVMVLQSMLAWAAEVVGAMPLDALLRRHANLLIAGARASDAQHPLQ